LVPVITTMRVVRECSRVDSDWRLRR
jgi:hypothetical protein